MDEAEYRSLRRQPYIPTVHMYRLWYSAVPTYVPTVIFRSPSLTKQLYSSSCGLSFELAVLKIDHHGQRRLVKARKGVDVTGADNNVVTPRPVPVPVRCFLTERQQEHEVQVPL
jgi:hypothetical protein